ncbi:hypothetical protein ACSLBF_19395 (plasmid) [Pseudoalteromonas sp. T1lg65]|uniref:hypothetical protein n=1 Tax=Pseudoalteromonas sp. T1lg65 TaxID=2077101 RepID=UPI003F78B35E
MASYARAFETVIVFNWQQADIFSVEVEKLACWQTMKGVGFSEYELYQLFKQEYCEELWYQLHGDELANQSIANLLFKASIKGYIDILLCEFQQHFLLPVSGQMCHLTLSYFNQLDYNELARWLCLTSSYIENLALQPTSPPYRDDHNMASGMWLH